MPIFRDEQAEEENDNLFDDVVRMADRLGLQGDNRANYIDDHMTQAGFERIQTRESYVKMQNSDDDPGDSGTNRWFGRPKGPAGQQQQQGRPPANSRQQSGADSDRY